MRNLHCSLTLASLTEFFSTFVRVLATSFVPQLFLIIYKPSLRLDMIKLVQIDLSLNTEM